MKIRRGFFKNLFQRKTAENVQQPKKRKRIRKKRARFLGNIKIAPKLLAAFLIIALLSTGMGAYAALSLQQVSTASSEMYSNILLPLRNAADAQKSFQEVCNQVRQLVLDPDSVITAAYYSKIETSRRQMDSNMAMVEALMSSEHKDRLDRFKTALASYSELLDRLLEKAKSGNIQELAKELTVYGDYRTLETQMDTTLKELTFLITINASTINSMNERTAKEVMSITLISTGVLLLLAVLIGVLMSRGISKPVKRLTGRIKQLAAGDTDFEITGTTQKDEIGQMREAVRTILKSLQALTDDTNMLIDAATEGRLSVRADAQKHQGAYRKIVEGINTTLDAMIAPINESSAVLEAFSAGNLNASVEGDFAGDFAIIKNTLNSTIEALKGYISEITQVLGDVAKGVLTVSIEADFKGDFSALKQSINKSIDAFNGVLKDINMAAEEVALGAAQLSGGSQVISQGAAEQASAIEQLTASISEIAEKTKNNAKSVNESSSLSLAAMDDAASGNEKMKLLQNAMEEINASSSSISKIIKVIDDIAFQTNILALNAAVEAARAGVHGKGFAVVAEEVRNLAARSAKAAHETAELIEGSIGKTAAGTKIADETAAALNSIVEGIQKTVTLSSEIAEASSEQATGIAQVDKGIEQLATVVQNSSATAQEAAASSQELAAQAEHLKAMVGRFKFRQEDSAGVDASKPPTDTSAPDETQSIRAANGASPSVKNSDQPVVLSDDDFGKY